MKIIVNGQEISDEKELTLRTSQAMTNLAMIYQKFQLNDLAIQLLTKAADLGQGNAQYHLSQMHMKGVSTKQSFKIAREYLLKSSRHWNQSQENAIQMLAFLEKGCSYCFTPTQLMNLHLQRKCKCKLVHYCNDICK